MEEQNPKSIRVQDEIGNAFIAIADSLNIDRNELLEKLMASYIESVRVNVADLAYKHPQFAAKHPFVQ